MKMIAMMARCSLPSSRVLHVLLHEVEAHVGRQEGGHPAISRWSGAR